MARSIVNQGLYLQREAVPGQALTTAMRRYLGIRGSIGWDIERDVERAAGYKASTGETETTRIGTADLEVRQDFNAMLPLMSGVFGAPITVPLTATPTPAYRHIFDINPRRADELATFTAIWGDPVQALQATYMAFHGMTLGVQRDEISLDANAILRAPTTGATIPTGTNEVQTVTITGSPTGGTFTLTFGGQTTGPIAYNATAAAVATALQALSSIGAGNVTTGGGPLPGTAVTVTFQNDLGGTNVAMMTASGAGLTGGTSPAVTVAETTAGVASGVTEIPMRTPRASQYNVWLDTSWAALGTTKLLEFYATEIDWSDKLEPNWVVNSAVTSYSELLEAEEIDYTQSLTVGFDSVGVAQINEALDGKLKFVRVGCTGASINGTDNFGLQIDTAVALTPTNVTRAPNSPATVVEFDGTLQVDATSGKFCRAVLTNTVASL